MEEEQKAPRDIPKKSHWLIRCLRWTGLFLLVILLGSIGFAGWVFQSNSGQQWLLHKVNTALESKPDQPGMAFKLTKLSGSLPFNMEFGLEAYDSQGVWLIAPNNTFILNWHDLPKIVHVAELKLINADLIRFPHSPQEETSKETDKPYTLVDLQATLKEITDFLSQKHWWLPAIKIENTFIQDALLPQKLITQNESRLRISANLSASFEDNAVNAELSANTSNEDNSPVNLETIEFKKASVNMKFSGKPHASVINANLDLQASLDSSVIRIKELPEEFFGHQIQLNTSLNIDANTETPGFKLDLKGPDLGAGNAKITTAAAWQSGPGWEKGELDGPIDFQFVTNIIPLKNLETDSPLNIIRAPIELLIHAKGDFPKVALNVNLNCSELVKDPYEITDLRLILDSGELDIPLNKTAILDLEKENQIELKLVAFLNKEKIDLSTEAFFQALEKENSEQVWRTGLRQLDLTALNAKLSGNVAAILIPGQKPSMDGDLKLAIDNWDGFKKFIPNQKLSGNLITEITLKSGFDNDPNHRLNPELSSITSKQAANLLLNIPHLSWEETGNTNIVQINNLQTHAEIIDPLEDLSLKASLEANSILAFGFNIKPQIKASGAIKGPLDAEITTHGSLESKIVAQWKPGILNIKTLTARMNSANLLRSAPDGKSTILGLDADRPVEITYGDTGVGVRGADIKILPSGRLRANGGFSPTKLDFNLALENLVFKPWQALAAQIPLGSANIQINLNGTPQRPGGSFKTALNNIQMTGSSLAPVSFTLTGGIQNTGTTSALGLKLDVDLNTLKTLGGSVAKVTARVPLIFGTDGIPKLNMTGPLSAEVHWDGALGPIWNLLPIADQRLNGRVKINLNAQGSLNAPKIHGGVEVDKGRYENLSFGVLLTDIMLRLSLTEKGTIQQIKNNSGGLPGGMNLLLSLSDGRGGTVKIDGNGALDGKDLNIKAKIDRLKPLRRRDIHVELSGDADITGTAFAPNVTGEITVNRGEVLLNNLDLGSSSVTTLTITDPADQKSQKTENTTQGTGSLNIRFVMLPRFTVEGRGLGSVWQANLLIQGALTEPKITGSINCVSGNFDFLGKNFALTKGTVTFAGGSLSNPLLNVELTNETPDLTAHIMVTGPINKLRLTLTSDPSLPRDDILSRVLFGKSINDLSRLEALQLAGAVAQLAGFGSGGSGILNFAKKALGVDVLRIGTSSSDAAGDGDDDAGGTTVEMGKYINDMIYMGVQQGMQSDSTAFIIQLELTPRTSIEVRSEENNTWGGLNWKYNY